MIQVYNYVALSFDNIVTSSVLHVVSRICVKLIITGTTRYDLKHAVLDIAVISSTVFIVCS